MLIYIIRKVNDLQLLHVTGTQPTCIFLHFIKVSSGPALQFCPCIKAVGQFRPLNPRCVCNYCCCAFVCMVIERIKTQSGMDFRGQHSFIILETSLILLVVADM